MLTSSLKPCRHGRKERSVNVKATEGSLKKGNYNVLIEESQVKSSCKPEMIVGKKSDAQADIKGTAGLTNNLR